MASDFIDSESVMRDENDFDIIIVGAGLTGLTCAYNILKRKPGLDVLIIEANDEIGGRIRPKDCSDTFHANFLQKHITELVKTLHIGIGHAEDTEDKKRILYRKGGPLHKMPRFYGAEVHNFLQTIEETSLDPRFTTYVEHEDAKQLAETSVGQLLRMIVLFPYARSLCRAFLSSMCASRNLDDISALWFIAMLNGASGLLNRLKITIGDRNRYFIQGGVSKVAQELLKRILMERGKIKYVQSVNKIIFNEDRAYVFSEKIRLRCEFVVVAVPPPMHNDIVIQTPSEYSLNTEIKYSPGENVFFNIIYKTPPWSSNYTGDIFTTWDCNSNLNIAYNATHSGSRKFVLGGFLAESNTTHTQKKGLFDTLDECFKSTEAMNYMTYKERNGSSIEARDSSPMSVMKPASLNNHVNYMGVPIGRIFFASSEYAVNWPGTIDGAIEAGEVTAYSILSIVRPQVLTFHELSTITSTSRKRKLRVPFKICAIQYLGLVLHIAVFLSFLKNAYDDV
ncbi:amine oxidase [flavin-containing] B-like [Calliopsis andreniformis]|uniref:amine oxidase [flavin-containing] B-like n=1 Tax=Calliopsis andreniformis TaxID=337506 RepID=UPI003FCC8C88